MSLNPALATPAFKISAQQERAWLQQGAGMSPFAQCVVALDATCDVEKLRQAVRQVVAKYEILRTVFRRQTGVKLPFQVIQQTGQFAFETNSHDDLEELLRREREYPFDFEHGPLLRAVLVTKRPGTRLILTLPALCADASSLKTVALEIAEGYRGGLASEGVMQYADLVEWQNEMSAGEETKAGRDFWRDHCRAIDFSVLSSLSLPGEKNSEPAAFCPDLYSVRESELGSRVDQLAQLAKVSSEDVLAAAWRVLLSRLLGTNEVTLGHEIDGRRYEELQSAVGPLARVVPLRTEIKVDTSFREFLHDAQSLAAEAKNWQECFSWGEIGEAASAELPFSFAVCDLSSGEVKSGVEFRAECLRVVQEHFKLRLVAIRRGPDLDLEFHYDATRVERASVERIAGYYRNLLARALSHPETPTSRLPLLLEGERQQILVGWNATAAAYPDTYCIHELFELQAARTPERIAVRGGEQKLTYAELNAHANQLAHHLRQHGVAPDKLVGLCLERSAESMIAVLAILKAGGAYVPLNTDNPPTRLRQQLEGAAVVITESKFVTQIPQVDCAVIVLDRDQKSWASQPETDPTVITTPENVVYVIYTSGSTGVPKGVAVRHRNLVNYADFIRKLLELEKYPDGLQFATVSTLGADLGNTCIYPSLISGGCLHIVSYQMATDSRQLAQYVRQYPIDVLKIVPSHLQALLQSDDAHALLPRKYLILGGETLTPKLLNEVTALNPTCEVVNHYGPTETTVGSLTLKLKDYDWRRAQLSSVPIGRPIQNTQVFVLDQNLEPAPVGVTGDLYIAGTGVTAGYLGQNEKTAERFLPNPFSSDVNGKMYRTGDLARYLENGLIEFLGRSDDQVKVRGFRIELGEIEAVLGRHSAVKQAVVLAKEDEQGDKRLVGYVVLGNEQAATAEELRDYVKQHLPSYMVPSATVLLAKLPLTANGKIDRKALPEPEQVAERLYVAPRNETETIIAGIWAEVLRREAKEISIHDDFFALGGHSLLATQVVSRIRRGLNVDLPLRSLFECPTVADLAKEAARIAASEQVQLPPIVKVPRDKPLPLSLAQQRLWVLDRIEPNNPLYNIPRAIRMTGELKTDRLVAAINELVRRHESLRTTFISTGDGQPVQVIAEALTLEVPVIDVSRQPRIGSELEAKEIAAREAATPFDLSTGPLVRARIVKLGETEYILLLTLHHIISDAWSAAVLFQELGELYRAFLEGKPSPLPDLAIQYADYAVWQRSVLRGTVLEKQLDFWRNHLKGAPPVLQIPTDRPRPQVRKFYGGYELLPLDIEVMKLVKSFSQREGVTPFMTMLAAYNALLSRYSQQDHIVLGTDVANRTTAETERLIGFFINLLPLHTDLSGDPSFTELVARVREGTLGAYAHQDLPFDKLVEDLQPERSASHNPIVQALFVMQNIPPQQREFPGLQLSPMQAEITRSKFDVALFIRETAEGMVEDWIYSTELFDRNTILRMASHFETFLRSALTQPDSRISAIEFMSRNEKLRADAEAKSRKASRRKKLLRAEPKAVSLASAWPEGTSRDRES